MGKPRMSIRGLMAGVLIIGLSLGLGPPAYEVYHGRRPHSHVFVQYRDQGTWLDYESGIFNPFWHSLILRLSGKPWKRQPICGSGRGRLEETCEIDDVNILFRGCFSSYKHPVISEVLLKKHLDLKLGKLVQASGY